MTPSYRIDVLKDDQWIPGRVTFSSSYPLEAIEEAADYIHRIFKTPVRIVQVDEIVTEHVEVIELFDQPVEQIA